MDNIGNVSMDKSTSIIGVDEINQMEKEMNQLRAKLNTIEVNVMNKTRDNKVAEHASKPVSSRHLFI